MSRSRSELVIYYSRRCVRNIEIKCFTFTVVSLRESNVNLGLALAFALSHDIEEVEALEGVYSDQAPVLY
jgi:hypothetical protein